MSIEILNENFNIMGDDTTTEYKERFLKDIENDIKNILVNKQRNKQPLFNSLIKELINLKKFNSDLRVFSGLNVAYFFNLYTDGLKENIKFLKGLNSMSLRISNLLKNCEYLKPQFNGLEITFKPQETEIRKIKSRNLRF